MPPATPTSAMLLCHTASLATESNSPYKAISMNYIKYTDINWLYFFCNLLTSSCLIRNKLCNIKWTYKQKKGDIAGPSVSGCHPLPWADEAANASSSTTWWLPSVPGRRPFPADIQIDIDIWLDMMMLRFLSISSDDKLGMLCILYIWYIRYSFWYIVNMFSNIVTLVMIPGNHLVITHSLSVLYILSITALRSSRKLWSSGISCASLLTALSVYSTLGNETPLLGGLGNAKTANLQRFVWWKSGKLREK